jgi:hypothetical protein
MGFSSLGIFAGVTFTGIGLITEKAPENLDQTGSYIVDKPMSLSECIADITRESV